MFSSQNGGASWTPVDDAGLINKKVQALALDGSTLYAGTAGGGVFKLDAGTWTQVNTGLVALAGECGGCPLQVLSLATDSRTPGIVYAGTEGAGLYKSINSRCELGAAPDDHQPGVSLGLPREGRDPGRARRRDTEATRRSTSARRAASGTAVAARSSTNQASVRDPDSSGSWAPIHSGIAR